MRVLKIAILLILLGLIVSGCGSSFPTPTPPPPPKCEYDVDPVFREFYANRGGRELLGCPISPKLFGNGKEYQYTPAVFLGHDPTAPRSSQVYFLDLGVQLQLMLPPLNPDAPLGHEVYQAFAGQYAQLGGAWIVGRPITGVVFDGELDRIYQCFENLCMYIRVGDPEAKVGLLALGADRCGLACGYEPVDLIESAPEQTSVGSFGAIASRIGFDLTGPNLSNVYVSPEDGFEEQIYANLVFYLDPSKPSGAALRPVPLLLGIPVDPFERAMEDPDSDFHVVQGDLGFNVPRAFTRYIKEHGGFEIIGKPITSYRMVSTAVYRQCFENICLDYLPNQPEGLQVQPMSLGYNYQNMLHQQGVFTDFGNSFEGVQLTVWETNPVLAPGASQVINALLLDNDTPMRNVELSLLLAVPGQGAQLYNLPPTDDSGRTSFSLPPLYQKNGTYIEYRVCVINLAEIDRCVEESFLIWMQP